jgi:hypothetical protein
MTQVFLSYARTDGLAAATRLRTELTAMGFQVWRDLEEMQGGLQWKKQLLAALEQVDAVLVLLTPAAAASPNVTWEWENALLRDRRVIPLLVAPCAVPAELERLHYHRLDDPAAYTLGLAHLARDLVQLAPAGPAAPPPPGGGSTYNVGTAINSAIGNNSAVFNQGGPSRVDAAAISRTPAAVPGWPGAGGLTGAQFGEFQRVLTQAFAPQELAVLVRIHLGEDLAAIALGKNHADTVFELVRWAERQGRLADLLAGALAENPGNPQLRAFAQQAGLL